MAELLDLPPPMVGAGAHFPALEAARVPRRAARLPGRDDVSFLRSTGSPPAVAPCSWKYLFEISMPMMLTTLPMDPPLSCPERTPCAFSSPGARWCPV